MHILLWIIIWYAAFAGYYLFFKKRSFLYMNSPKVIAGWYGFMTLIGVILFYRELGTIFLHATTLFTAIGGMLAVTTLAFWYHSLTKRTHVENAVSKNIFFSKTAEVIFQQVMIWALFGLLPSISLFGAVFFAIHIPLIAVIEWKRGVCFVAASLIGGIIFAACLKFIPAGWFFACALHIGFYSCIALKRQVFGMKAFSVL